MKKVELLAPVGNIKKLNTALHFGADAVYFAGKNFGLRAYADNLDYNEIVNAVDICHAQNKKAYVTVNIFAQNYDFGSLKEYIQVLEQAKVDAVIVSDVGVIAFIKKHSPNLKIHLSTQANTLNKYAVEFWRDMGLERIVLARELSIDEIKEIKDFVQDSVQLETFIHGAMCVSYSGRCLLSNYFANRDSNRGECVQACRWEYNLTEKNRSEQQFTIMEDERGSYILNSMDLCCMPFLDRLIDAGVDCLKIEGRMKSEYYIATVVNAYRKRLDDFYNSKPYNKALMQELYKVKHRKYTDGFYLNKQAEICYNSSASKSQYVFVAEVLGYDENMGAIVVEQRNRFHSGESLEILSVTDYDNQVLQAECIYDQEGSKVEDCKIVQQKLYIKSPMKLKKYDILRRKNK